MADRNRELVPDNWSLVRERADRGRMADRNRELVPDNWSLVRERALTLTHNGSCTD